MPKDLDGTPISRNEEEKGTVLALSPGDCVLYRSHNGPRSGVVIGSRRTELMLRYLEDQAWVSETASQSDVMQRVVTARGLEVVAENGVVGVCTAVDVDKVTMDDGSRVPASTVRCPHAKATPIVACVSKVAFAAVEAARQAATATLPSEMVGTVVSADTRAATEMALEHGRQLAFGTRDALRQAVASQKEQEPCLPADRWKSSLQIAKEKAAPLVESGQREAAALGETVKESRAGKLALEEVAAVSKNFEVDDTGALATLHKAASVVSKSNDKLAATAKKLARRLAVSHLLDDSYIEQAFSAALSTGGQVLAGAEQTLARRLGEATRKFASDVLLADGDVDRCKVEAALASAVTAAVDAAPPMLVAEVCASADCFQGALFVRLNGGDDASVSTSSAVVARLASKYSQQLLGDNEPEVLKRALSSLGDGTGVRETLAKALDDEDAVRGVGDAVSGTGAKLAAALSALDKDERAKHFTSKLLEDDTGLASIIDALAGLDVDQASERIEALLKSDASERAKLVERATDAALDFFLMHLPAMPVSPVELERDGVLYELGNLSLSKFRLEKEDVKIELPFTAATSNDEKYGFFLDGQLSEVTANHKSSFSFGLKARRASAKFDAITWRFKQQYFPYLEGSGTADVVAEEGSLWLEVGASRREDKPIVSLTRCDVVIGSLEVRVDNMQFGWLINALGSVFREQVRQYVQDALRKYIKRRARDVLSPLDTPLASVWPAVARVFSLPEPAKLPLANLQDLDDHVVRLELTDPGPLGLELAATPDTAHFTLTGIVESGQAARAVSTPRVRMRSLLNAVLIAVDETELGTLQDQQQAIALITSLDRPKILFFRLDQVARPTNLSGCRSSEQPSKFASSSLGSRSIELIAASAPNRPVTSLGLKLRAHPTVGAVEIAKANDASMVGCLLVGCTGRPYLVSRTPPVDASAVGVLVSTKNADAAREGRAFSIYLSDSPDFRVHFDEPPVDLLFQAHACYAVIAALEPAPSPLQLAGAQVGDIVVAVGTENLPTPSGYASDVCAVLKAAVHRAALDQSQLHLTLRRQNRLLRLSLGPFDKPILGATFTRDEHFRAPCIKRFDGVPGPVARSRHWQSQRLHPGLALVALGNATDSLRTFEPDVANREACRAQLADASYCVFRDVEAYEALLNLFGTRDRASN